MRKSLILSLLFLILLNLSSAQAAQVLFTPGVVAYQQYTDNLYLDYQDEVDDFITGAGLELTGEVLWRTAGLSLNYSPTYFYYWENDQLNYLSHLADFNIWKDFSRRSRLELRNHYLQTNDPTAAIITPEGGEEPVDVNRRDRNPYAENTAEAEYAYNFGSDDRFSIALLYNTWRELEPPPGIITNDNNNLMPSVGLIYNFTQRWGFDLDASYSMRDYFEQNDRTEFNGNVRLRHSFSRVFYGFVNYRHTTLNYDQPVDEDYIVYEPSIGGRYTFREGGYFEVAVGYIVQEFEFSDSVQEPSILLDLNKRWNFRTGYFGISAASGYRIDDGSTSDYGLNLYALGRIDAGYNFTAHLLGTVYGSYRRDDYLNSPDNAIGQTILSGAGLTWQALQWMSFRLSYDFRTYISNRPTEEYTENRAQLTLRLAPSTPFRWN